MTIEYKDSKRIVGLSLTAGSEVGETSGTSESKTLGVTGSRYRGGIKIATGSALIGQTLSPTRGIKFELKRTGLSGVNSLSRFEIWNDTTIIANATTTFQPDTKVGTSYAYVEFFPASTVTLQANDRITIATDGGVTNYYTFKSNASGSYDTTKTHWTESTYNAGSGGTWSDDTGIDGNFKFTLADVGDVKPTDVQDNSIMIEKDTARRYWVSVIGDTGLKAYYKFNASTGNIENKSTSSDSIGSSGDMTITGAAYEQTGIIGNALSFDGSNDYGNIPTSPMTSIGTGNFGISFWVKSDDFAGGGAPCFMGSYNASSEGGEHWQLYESGGVVKLSNGSTTIVTSITNAIEDNAWHHIVLTRSGSTVTAYLDGSSVSTHTYTADFPSPSTYLRIAQRGDGYQYCDTELDELSFWNRALTSSDVTALYNSGSGQAVGATWTRQIPYFTASFWGAGGTATPWTPVNYHNEYAGGTWSTATALGTAVQMVAGCGTKTAGLVIGGDTSGTTNPISTVQAWNGSTWSTSTGGTMNVARNQHAAGGSSISAWACAGRTGSSGNNTSSFWNNSSWTSGAIISTTRRNHGGAGSTDDCWVTGGYDESNNLATTEQYNGTTWSLGGNISVATDSITEGGGDTYNAIITGGYDGSNNSNRTNIYNGTAWSLGGNLSNASKYNTTSGTPQDAGAYLGYVSSWTPTWSETYNGTSWTTQGSVSNGRSTGAGGN